MSTSHRLTQWESRYKERTEHPDSHHRQRNSQNLHASVVDTVQNIVHIYKVQVSLYIYVMYMCMHSPFTPSIPSVILLNTILHPDKRTQSVHFILTYIPSSCLLLPQPLSQPTFPIQQWYWLITDSLVCYCIVCLIPSRVLQQSKSEHTQNRVHTTGGDR